MKITMKDRMMIGRDMRAMVAKSVDISRETSSPLNPGLVKIRKLNKRADMVIPIVAMSDQNTSSMEMPRITPKTTRNMTRRVIGSVFRKGLVNSGNRKWKKR